MRILILWVFLFLNVNYAMADAYDDFITYHDNYLAEYAVWEQAQADAVAAQSDAQAAQSAYETAVNNRDNAWDAYNASVAKGDDTATVDAYYDAYVAINVTVPSLLNTATTLQSTATSLQNTANFTPKPIDSLGLAQAKFQGGQTLDDTEYWLVYNSALRDYNNGIPVTPLEETMLIEVYQDEHEEELTAEALAAPEVEPEPEAGDPSGSTEEWLGLAATGIATYMATDAGSDGLINTASVEQVEGANLDQLLSMNSMDDYDVLEHVQQTFDMGCAGFDDINFIKGACTWLKCGFLYCSIRVSAIVEHKSPDLMVEVSGGDKDSIIGPIDWISDGVEDIGIFLHSLVGLDVGAIKSGVRGPQKSDGGGKIRENFNVFDVTVMGNPYLYLYETALGTLMESLEVSSFCYSRVVPFKPYYTTKTDPEWRFGLGERLNSLGDTVTLDPRNINNYGNHFNFADPAASLDAALGIYWGYLYPRIGFSKNQSIYRSAGLIAQRVGSIISYNSGDDGGINMHVSTTFDWPPTETGSGTKSYGISPVIEHDDKHGWQLNYPQGKRGDGCYRFPDVSWDGADYINGTYPQKVIGTEMVQVGTTTVSEPITIPLWGYGPPVIIGYHDVEVPVYEEQDITEDVTSNQVGDQIDLTSDSNAYVFTLWRTYKCCTKKGKFLFDVKW